MKLRPEPDPAKCLFLYGICPGCHAALTQVSPDLIQCDGCGGVWMRTDEEAEP